MCMICCKADLSHGAAAIIVAVALLIAALLVLLLKVATCIVVDINVAVAAECDYMLLLQGVVEGAHALNCC
jgi:hypothetical protein